MDHSQRVEAAERELRELQAAVTAGPLDAAVPTCPDWTVEDLARHVGGFCGFWSHVLCEGTGTPKPAFGDPPTGDAVVGWLAESGGTLVDQLHRAAGDLPVWTWFEADQTAGFVARRSANELAIHRYDAQSARDTCAPIDPTLAVDVIDEVFDALITRRPRSGAAAGQTMHLHGTDEVPGGAGSAEWLVTLHPDRVEARREHAKGDLAVRAPVSDLALLLFRRPALGDVQRFGDDAVLDVWYGEFMF
jgi:uncharacterized protein (TIGR03083 family)